MFGGTQEQQLQPTTQAPTTAEEEALKRNTDCVYFLASPLTCKKGSECEYRHSDIARVNPRDCWYWLNGNCLNPKCGFRHPPLDGLLGTQVPTPLGPSLPPSHTLAAPSSLAPYVTGKQAVPCIYFQRGNCLKGGMCPFTHAPFPVTNKVAQFAAITPVTESQSNKKTFGGLEKCSQEQKISDINVPKSVELPLQAKEVTRIQMYQLSNGVIRKNVPLPTSLKDEFSRYMAGKVHSSSNWNSVSRSNRNHQVHVPDNQSILNCKEAEEFSREPSPGFDVLVDDELRDSDYYPSEDQFGKTRGHEGRNLNPTNDYEIGRSDYNSMTDANRNTYHESHGYESNERLQVHYGWEEHRASSERMIGGLAHLERRRYPRADSADQIDESDLRHHLSKQKRGNGLRSIISHDHTSENPVADRSFRVSRRDHLPAQESSVSSRLRGRIKIPGRSTSPVNKNDTWSEREIERGRHHGKSSPERPQGRLRDRMKGRVHEDLNNEERNFRGPRIRRDTDDHNAELTGPKKLEEQKVGKESESYNQHMSDRLPLGKRKYPRLDGAPQQVEGDMSFEGPKPLSEILKRKRGGEIALYESGMTSVNNEDNDQKKGQESFMMPIGTKETKGVFSFMFGDELNRVHRNKEDSKPAAGDIGETAEKIKSTEIEEGMIADEAMEDQEAEGYDQREGEYDYEQAGGEDYNLDEGENVDPEEEYYEEDDDADDFAKKMGVMYS